MQQANRTRSLDEPGLISRDDLLVSLRDSVDAATSTALSAKTGRRRPIVEGQIRVEVEVDDAMFLSFEDHAKNRFTAKLEPTEVKALASMLLLAEDRGADSRCILTGSVEVSHVST